MRVFGGRRVALTARAQVDDPVSWHEANLARNRVHYSLLARAGAPAVVAVSERVGCGVHWNAYARLSTGQTIKYGVVRTDSLVRDLTTWDALYVAGRLHKPVRVVASDARVAAAAQTNLRSALAAALLLLPPEFSEAQLHAQLVGLSYGGDVRLAFGAEDPHKVGRIAAGSAPALRQLYTGAVAAAAAGLWSLPARRWAQKADAAAREALLRQLPRSLLRRLAPEAGEDAAAAAASVAASPQPAARVRAALAATVRASSARAAVAGLLTAGLGGATRYAAQKFAKAWRLRATSAAGATCL